MQDSVEQTKTKASVLQRIAARLGYVRSSDAEELLSAWMTGQAAGVAQDKPYSALVDSYKSWVYTSVDKIGKTVAMLPVRLYVHRDKRRGGKKILSRAIKAELKALPTDGDRKYRLKEMGVEREEVLDHPFLDLMHRPNHLMSRFLLWYETMIRLELAGICGWYMPPNRLGLPAEIWPLPLTRTATLQPVVLPDMRVRTWSYRDGNVVADLPPEQVLLHRYPSPVSPYHGMSPLMAQTHPYDLDMYLMQQQVALYQNKGVPGLHLHTDKDLTPRQVNDALRRLREQWGGVTKSGAPLVTHSGFTADKTGFSPRENMINEVAKYAREKLITSYDLSEGKLGLVSDVNRSNIEALDDTFVRECLGPKCMILEEAIEVSILPRYDDGLSLDFVLPDTGDKAFRVLEREANLRNYYSTVNEERSKEGLPPVPWGDAPWMPFSVMQPGGAMPPMLQAPAGQRGDATPYEVKADAVSEDARRRQEWLDFAARSRSWEGMLAGVMAQHFRAQRDAVLARLDADGKKLLGQYAGWSRKAVQDHLASGSRGEKGIDEINIDPAVEAATLRAMFLRPLLVAMEAEGNQIFRGLSVPQSFNVNDPRVLQWLGTRMEMFSAEVQGTTFDVIKAVLREGFAEGRPVATIAETLREKFASWEMYRAPLIARTETIAALNRTKLFAGEQSGVQDQLLKTWLSAGDEETRESHLAADRRYAKGIPVDEEFEVGGDRMLSPGNGSSAEENVNCRCTMGYVRVGAT